MESMVKNHFWQDRRVFVTGGSGFVGGWLIQELLRLGAGVVTLLRDWVPQSQLLTATLLNKTAIVRGDLSDSRQLERILSEYEIQSVFHLAAQTIVPIANKNPLSTFESNIAGTWNLLEACRQVSSISSIVIASSDKAYGETKELPYQETTPLQAIYPYDVSKACADMIGVSYAKTFDLPVAITRCANFFGGGDLNWNRIIPGTIRAIIRGTAPVIRSDGTLVRDYMYIEDAVHAYITLGEALTHNPLLKGEAFNFSSDSPKNVMEIVNIIIHTMDSNLVPNICGDNHGEIVAQYLDASKSHNLLDWQPKFGWNEGLCRTIHWYQSYLEKQDAALSVL